MNIKEDYGNIISGELTVTKMTEAPVFNEKGEIVNKTKVVSETVDKNTIVFPGRTHIADLMNFNTSTVAKPIRYFGIGDGEAEVPNPPSPTDTGLLNEIDGDNGGNRFAIDRCTQLSDASLMYTTVIPSGQATGLWNEVGLFLDDGGLINTGTMFSRRTYATADKEANVFLVFRWVISF